MDYTAAKDSKLAAVLGSHGQWEVGGGGGGWGELGPFWRGGGVVFPGGKPNKNTS